MRDVLDALEEVVTAEQLHEIDPILQKALDEQEASIPAEEFWAEMDSLPALGRQGSEPYLSQ